MTRGNRCSPGISKRYRDLSGRIYLEFRGVLMGLSLFYKSVSTGRSSASPSIRDRRSTKSMEDIPKPIETTKPADNRSMSAGYRELTKNKTLAGREAARTFSGIEKDAPSNRLKMVSRLRHKEKFLFWRH